MSTVKAWRGAEAGSTAVYSLAALYSRTASAAQLRRTNDKTECSRGSSPLITIPFRSTVATARPVVVSVCPRARPLHFRESEKAQERLACSSGVFRHKRDRTTCLEPAARPLGAATKHARVPSLGTPGWRSCVHFGGASDQYRVNINLLVTSCSRHSI